MSSSMSHSFGPKLQCVRASYARKEAASTALPPPKIKNHIPRMPALHCQQINNLLCGNFIYFLRSKEASTAVGCATLRSVRQSFEAAK